MKDFTRESVDAVFYVVSLKLSPMTTLATHVKRYWVRKINNTVLIGHDKSYARPIFLKIYELILSFDLQMLVFLYIFGLLFMEL